MKIIMRISKSLKRKRRKAKAQINGNVASSSLQSIIMASTASSRAAHRRNDWPRRPSAYLAAISFLISFAAENGDASSSSRPAYGKPRLIRRPEAAFVVTRRRRRPVDKRQTNICHVAACPDASNLHNAGRFECCAAAATAANGGGLHCRHCFRPGSLLAL